MTNKSFCFYSNQLMNKIEGVHGRVSVDPRKVKCVIGSEQVEFLVDSGAAVNTITDQIWRMIREGSKTAIQDLVMYPKDVLKGYANESPLDVLCSFASYIGVKGSTQRMVLAKFFVVNGTQLSLLGYDTSCMLKILHIGPLGTINWIEAKSEKVKFYSKLLIR